jgi:hypothetical protein
MMHKVETLGQAKQIAKRLRGTVPVLYIAATGGYCWTVSDTFSTEWDSRPICAVYPNNRTVFEAGWAKIVRGA